MKNESNGQPAANPPTVHQMVILFNETTGELGIQGVPLNRITALGMLRMAEHLVVNANQAQARQSPIVQLPPGARLT